MFDDDFTREIYGDILIERVNLGRITIKEAQVFKERLFSASASGFKKFIVDFSTCQFIDSAIIGVLVLFLKKISHKSGELKVVIPPEESFQVFTLSGLFQVFNLYNTVEEAKKSFEL